MRLVRLAPLLALALLASPAAASSGGRPESPPPSPAGATGGMDVPETRPRSPRDEAQEYFRGAWSDVERGKQFLQKGRRDMATKSFRRALERSREAVEHDSTLAEAWNLVGFSSRKLGDYPAAFAAYRTALRLKPDFALALEYYGEGLLETNDVAGARAQLAALRKTGAQESIEDLEEAIEAWEKAHPGAVGAATGH